MCGIMKPPLETPPSETSPPGLPPPEILYENGPCLVVNKPPGLLTQAPPGIDSIEVRIKAFLKAREGKPGNVYLGVPHRLDRPASGVDGLRQARPGHAAAGRAVRGPAGHEGLLGLRRGPRQPAPGTWQDHLRKVPDEARAEVVPADHPEGRPAVLHYRTLMTAEWGTWLEIELETGRTHQVRVQSSSRGHPVLGDRQYGSGTPFGPQHDDARLGAIALHARSLTFRHPMTQEQVEVIAPAPAYWPRLHAMFGP